MIEKSARKELESYVFQRMSESGIVGLSLATVEDGKVSYSRGFGFRDFDRGTSSTPGTTYCVGSVTKPFTALAVMQLQERGLLDLDDPVERHLDFVAHPMGEPILVRHLLSHTSGLPSLGYAEVTLGMATDTTDDWYPIANPRDLLVFMDGAEDWALDKPGRRHAYLNEGYILLGSVIEKVSGVGYAEYVKQNILEPLQMRRSTFDEEDVERDGDVATPYVTRGGEKVATRYPFGQMIADGGLMSNALDMARFVAALLSGGELDGVRVTSSETVRDMMEPKIRTTEEPYDGVSYHGYGYGLRVKEGFLDHHLVYHSGSVYGSSGYMGLISDEGVGVVVLANGGYFLEDMGEYALALLTGRDPLEIPYFRRTMQLDELAGTYTTFRDTSSYDVARSGGILDLTTSLGSRTYTRPLIPIDLEGEPREFRLYGLDTATPVQFHRRGAETVMVYDRTMAKRRACP